MKIRFLADYRGTLTNEQMFYVGDEADLSTNAELVAEGRAEYIDQEPVLAVDLDGLTVNELKALARDAGVEYYYRLKRDELIASLRDD